MTSYRNFTIVTIPACMAVVVAGIAAMAQDEAETRITFFVSPAIVPALAPIWEASPELTPTVSH